MMTPDEYRQRAAECFRLVNHVHSEETRLALTKLAQNWLRLADDKPLLRQRRASMTRSSAPLE